MESIQYGKILNKYLKKDEFILCGEDFILAQDNDPKHKSKIIQDQLTEKNIRVLDWSPNSPDLNPI